MFKILSSHMSPTGMYKIIRGSAKIYRVYKNSKAKDLYIKAQGAATPEEREKLFQQMGDYYIAVEKEKQPSKNRLMQFIKGIWNAY